MIEKEFISLKTLWPTDLNQQSNAGLDEILAMQKLFSCHDKNQDNFAAINFVPANFAPANFAPANFECRLVGGFVRDLMLCHYKDTPYYHNRLMGCLDIDMACTLPPDEILKRSQAQGFKAKILKPFHGVVRVKGVYHSYDICPLRLDRTTDGRHAEVDFSPIQTGDWLQDSLRRDFTFNALYLNQEGRLFDFHHGLEDLKAGTINFIGDGDERLKQDYLRLLRAIRFHSLVSDRPLPSDLLALIERHKHGMFKISPARLGRELCACLSMGLSSVHFLNCLSQAGLITPLIYEKTFVKKSFASDEDYNDKNLSIAFENNMFEGLNQLFHGDKIALQRFCNHYQIHLPSVFGR